MDLRRILCHFNRHRWVTVVASGYRRCMICDRTEGVENTRGAHSHRNVISVLDGTDGRAYRESGAYRDLLLSLSEVDDLNHPYRKVLFQNMSEDSPSQSTFWTISCRSFGPGEYGLVSMQGFRTAISRSVVDDGWIRVVKYPALEDGIYFDISEGIWRPIDILDSSELFSISEIYPEMEEETIVDPVMEIKIEIRPTILEW